jgi:hypothetical protein
MLRRCRHTKEGNPATNLPHILPGKIGNGTHFLKIRHDYPDISQIQNNKKTMRVLEQFSK